MMTVQTTESPRLWVMLKKSNSFDVSLIFAKHCFNEYSFLDV